MSDRDLSLPDLGYASIACTPKQTAVVGAEGSFQLGGDDITLRQLNHNSMTETDQLACLALFRGSDHMPDHLSSKMGHLHIMNYSRCYELHTIGQAVEMAACKINVNGSNEDTIQCQSDHLLEIRFDGGLGHYQQTQRPFTDNHITSSYGECTRIKSQRP
ncbi:hypothetical protein [Methylophaga frappieri]|uniref:hypothetical protein n=1 Tax=Methylophaga frappieri (strain ATCC BAA-2434 / DSM 25690 / JAM7) TaxID=754477 RepID=UPI00124890BE|nr:hypothetical protein [Methylophaga frappieri]